MLELLREAGPALVFLVAPFLASTAAALGCGAVHARLKRGQEASVCAGEWASREVALRGPSVRVGVSPEIVGSADGFWPERAFVGLSPRTWEDRTPAGRAVAAHELGHALAWRDDGPAARMRAWIRRLQAPALAFAGAGVLVGSLLDSRTALNVGFVALGIGLVTHIAGLLDEADASRRAARLLEARGERSIGTDLAMSAAFGVYLAPALVHAGFLLGWSHLADAALGGGPRLAANTDLALWGVLLLAPLLVLRAMQVFAELGRPEPITTEFRLNWTLFQERSWEFHAGLVVLVWLGLCWDEPLAAGMAPWFVLGVAPAMGPLGGIGRLLAVVPLFVVLGLSGFLKDPGGRSRAPRPVDPLDLIETDTPWIRRVGGLLRVAWLPLLGWMVAGAVSGW